jgi:hypothetical protein
MWWAVSAAVLAACTNPAQPQETSEGLPPQVVEQLADADPLVREILGDGVVTSDEYERAFYAMVTCVEEAGFVVEEAEVDSRPGHESRRVGYAGVEPGRVEELEQTEADCVLRYLDLVESIVNQQSRLSEEEYEDLYRRIAVCMRELGIELAADTREAVVEAGADFEAARAHDECYERER